MGTNYYVTLNPCAACGRGDEQIHIGKQSSGWRFLFAANKALDIYSWKDWRSHLSRAEHRDHISDEYGHAVSFAELVNTVENHLAEAWDAKTAPTSAWGPGSRENHERFDLGGYRFSLSDDFS